MTHTKPTPAMLNYLRIVRDYCAKWHRGIDSGTFAKLAWPDAEGWTKIQRVGNHGSHRGGGMVFAGGGTLGRLRRAGLVRKVWSDLGGPTFLPTLEGLQRLAVLEGTRPGCPCGCGLPAPIKPRTYATATCGPAQPTDTADTTDTTDNPEKSP